MGLTVAKIENGFTVTKGGNTYTVTDKNGNGVIDSKDVWTLGGKEPLSERELWEASGLSLGTKEELTSEEVAQYSKFKEQLAARENQEAQQQQQQLQQQKPKKQNFWSKLTNVATTVLPFMSFASMGIGLMSSWSLNGSAADNAIKWNSIGNLSSMVATTLAGINGMKNIQQNNNYSFMPQMSTYQQFPDYSEYMNTMSQQLENYNKQQEELAQKRKEAIEKSNNDKARTMIEQLATADNTVINAQNKSVLEDLRDIDGEKTYTEEEIAIANQIKTTPRIPVNHIDVTKTGDKTKITADFAQNLENLLAKYDKAEGDNKAKVMTEIEYGKIKTYLAFPTLTEVQVNELKELYKKVSSGKNEN